MSCNSVVANHELLYNRSMNEHAANKVCPHCGVSFYGAGATKYCNTMSTLTNIGQREDLEDKIYRVAPEETPFTSNIGSVNGKARTRDKGRLAHGETHASAKLTEGQVRDVLCSNASTKALARQLNVNPRTVRSIRQGRAWKHIPRESVTS